ncbi:hypothetical protein ACV1DC_08865, partial [Aeromonas caviae]
GDKIRSQSKPFLYLFQLVAAKDPVHESVLCHQSLSWFTPRDGLSFGYLKGPDRGMGRGG